MKRGILFIVLLLGIIYYFIPSVVSTWKVSNGTKEDILNDTFIKSGVRIQELNLNGWSQIEKKPMTLKEQKVLISSILQDLKLKGLKIKERDDKNFKGLQYTGWLDGDVVVSIVTQSIAARDKYSSGETYLMVSLKEKNNVQKNIKLQQIRKNIFKNFKGEDNFSTYLVGRIDGVKKTEDAKKYIIDKLKVIKVQEVKEGNLISLTGYSPLVKEKIKVGEDIVNINLAIRGNKSSKDRLVFLGTPIITGEY
jgi:hypothetical protein